MNYKFLKLLLVDGMYNNRCLPGEICEVRQLPDGNLGIETSTYCWVQRISPTAQIEKYPLVCPWGNEKRNYRSKQAPPSRKVGIKWLNEWPSLPTLVEFTNAGIDAMNIDAHNPGIILTQLGNQWRIDATTNLDLHPDYLPEMLLGVPSKSRFIQMENYDEACSLAKQLTGALNHE